MLRALTVGLLMTLGPGLADMALVTAGQPVAELIPAAHSGVAAYAAREIADLVEQATGARLPIVEQPTPGQPHIWLGACEAAAAAGLDPAGVGLEGFHLKTVGNELFIVGDDGDGGPQKINRTLPIKAGTLSGAYALLERVVGVRFYWHDELGTIVPKHTSLSVANLDLKQAPHWSYRTLPYSPEGQTYERFGRRQRLGIAWTMSHSHNWWRILPPDVYGQDHPEYFAERGGQRIAAHYMEHHGGQVCTTNPDVIRIFAETAIKFFDDNPRITMFSLSPNDGGGFCECANCRALDTGNWGDERDGQPIMTDRLLTFYNQIAERVAAKYPDRMLGAYVYSYYIKPPEHLKPHPNLALVFAVNSAGMQGAGWEREQQWIRQWTALTSNFYQYDIFWLASWSLGLPAPVSHFGIEKLRALSATSMKGGYLYIGPSYESLGALPYVAAKLMWDPTVDAAALERQYYNDLYEAAGPDVKAWYELVESRLHDARVNGIKTDDPTVARLAQAPKPHDAVTLEAYAPVLDQLQAIMDRAASRKLSPDATERLRRMRLHHDLARTTVTAYLGAERLTQGRWDPAEVAATKQAIEDRAEIIGQLRDFAPTLADILEQLDKRETARITPSAAAYQLASRSGPTVVYAPVAATPKLDGELDGPWQHAVWRELVHNHTAGAPAGPARTAFLRDARYLYWAVDGYDQQADKLAAKATSFGTALYSDDNVELFLQPPGETRYYHLAVGAGGATHTAVHPTGEASASEAWQPAFEAKVVRHAHGWRVEARLPLSALQPQPVSDATGWKLDVFRVRRGTAEPDEYTALAATFGSHHTPARFASLRFGVPPEREDFEAGGFEGLDAERFAKLVRVQVQNDGAVELADDWAYEGRNSVAVRVGEASLSALTVTAKARENTAYRISLAHRNEPAGLTPEVRSEAPIARVIYRGADGKAVTDTRGYTWAGAPLNLAPGEWRLHAMTFTTPPGTTQLSFTLFFHHPGHYRVDNLNLEALE